MMAVESNVHAHHQGQGAGSLGRPRQHSLEVTEEVALDSAAAVDAALAGTVQQLGAAVEVRMVEIVLPLVARLHVLAGKLALGQSLQQPLLLLQPLLLPSSSSLKHYSELDALQQAALAPAVPCRLTSRQDRRNPHSLYRHAPVAHMGRDNR